MKKFLNDAGAHVRKQALLADMQRRLRLLPAEDLQFLDELILKLQLNYTESLYTPKNDDYAAQRTPAMAFHYYAMAALEAADRNQKINAISESTGTAIDALNLGPVDLTVAVCSTCDGIGNFPKSIVDGKPLECCFCDGTGRIAITAVSHG